MISTIIITYNEEEVLEDCLKSLKDFTDEIIVVDSFDVENISVDSVSKRNPKK